MKELSFSSNSCLSQEDREVLKEMLPDGTTSETEKKSKVARFICFGNGRKKIKLNIHDVPLWMLK